MSKRDDYSNIEQTNKDLVAYLAASPRSRRAPKWKKVRDLIEMYRGATAHLVPQETSPSLLPIAASCALQQVRADAAKPDKKRSKK